MSKSANSKSDAKENAGTNGKQNGKDSYKSFGFSSSKDIFDPLSQYGQVKTLLDSSDISVGPVDNPTLKFRAQFDDPTPRKRIKNRQFDSGEKSKFRAQVDGSNPKKKIKNRHFDSGDKSKFRAQFDGSNPMKRIKNRQFDSGDKSEHRRSEIGNTEVVHDPKVAKLIRGPLKWYLDDEISMAKTKFWDNKRNVYNEELDKNTRVGERKVKALLKRRANMFCPRWYQDFSTDQVNNLMMLQFVIRKDCEEMITGRTRKSLLAIGIISTFFPLNQDTVKNLLEATYCNAIDFLREIYKMLTGNYFEEEGYKNFYDCNERIILTAIAFLTLPETVVELNKRLPPVPKPELPPKPVRPKCSPVEKFDSPYKEEPLLCPTWLEYHISVENWREIRKYIPIPKVILPPEKCMLTDYKETSGSSDSDNQGSRVKNTSAPIERSHTASVKEAPSPKGPRQIQSGPGTAKKKSQSGTTGNNPATGSSKNIVKSTADRRREQVSGTRKESVLSKAKSNTGGSQINSIAIPPVPDENKLFDFTINGISEKSGPVEYKICGVLQPPQENKKSWLGEKHAHYIISGAPNEPPTCPITYEMTGIANVTPTNSDERFFAVLKLGDGPKKIYPNGRKNLSRNWQEWLQSTDEEFKKMERQANKMIKSIEAVTRLVFPGPSCDSCCSCRQTRKSYLKAKDTKAPYFMIDTITEDSNKNKCLVGSMSMHSPAPTPPESTVNLLEIIASEDALKKSLVISGVTNMGDTQYFISGVKENMVRVPGRIVEHPAPRPPRNVPPCACAIQRIFKEGIETKVSHDHIPWTKDEGECFGNKFRPDEYPAYSCKKYPGDKSCRRNPFIHDITKMQKRIEKAKERELKGLAPDEEKRMYSIADVKPCGDEHGMRVCGGPWDAVHTLTPEELAEQEKTRKAILRGPPCGTTPGRAVCAGPFGERIPLKQFKLTVDDEMPGEGDEEEEGERKEEKPWIEIKEREKLRDMKCFMSPACIEGRKKGTKTLKKKFIPDSNYPGYDDLWNIHRTAPSEKASETDFISLLKLSSPQPRASDEPRAEDKSWREEKKSMSKSDVRRGDSSRFPSKSSERVGKSESKPGVRKEALASKKESRKVIGPKKSVEAIPDRGRANKANTKSKVTRDSDSKKSAIAFEKPKKEISQSERPSRRTDDTRKQRNSDTMQSRPLSPKKSDRTIPTESKHELAASKSEYVDKTSGGPSGQSRKRSSLKGRRPSKRDRTDEEIEMSPYEKITTLKSKLMSSELYPHDVKPAELPEPPPARCTTEYSDTQPTSEPVEAAEEKKHFKSKEPCGWKTKSEQELPTKKTLAYLTERGYPEGMIEVRPGGKPCLCRETRSKKKVMLYNLGGSMNKKKMDANDAKKDKKDNGKDTQVIDGVLYYTPPPSPRRSDEYVPEYEFTGSPYDMCLSKRTLSDLKYLEEHSGPKSLIQKSKGNVDSCGCNEYVDTYGIQDTNGKEVAAIDKSRQLFMESRSPKDRWNLALNDIDLVDYFTRCRGTLPCWLRCGKFNKISCPLSYRKLKIKKPVCECKYERKVLEYREQKLKTKEREKRLKTMKKQPYINVADISKPVIEDTKLLISGVKRIPRVDEYVDDVKYCITGVAENRKQAPSEKIVAGVQMATPINTPEPSVEDVPCVCLHRHWSPVDIPPGPLVTPEDIRRADEKRRREAAEKAYAEIHAPLQTYDSHGSHGCKEPCYLEDAESERDFKGYEDDKRSVSSGDARNKQKMPSDRREQESYSGGGQKKSITMKESYSGGGQKKSITMKNWESVKQSGSTVESSKSTASQRGGSNPGKGGGERSVTEYRRAESSNRLQKREDSQGKDVEESGESRESIKINWMALAERELDKMATEGYLFAKLPYCSLVPQLRNWLMYREGFVLTENKTRDLMRQTVIMWNTLGERRAVILPPTFDWPKKVIRALTYDNAKTLKKQIAKKTALFQSRARKARVLYARSLWNTMDYGRYPSKTFKNAFFTYMAAKESDGLIMKS